VRDDLFDRAIDEVERLITETIGSTVLVKTTLDQSGCEQGERAAGGLNEAVEVLKNVLYWLHDGKQEHQRHAQLLAEGEQ
jgi:hypothetical protein